jgi:bis(5'-nucleosidyl)-tetraphosphatase
MVHQERSAGVIVYRNPSGRAGAEEFLLLDYGRYWDYPKGHVEKGEDDHTTARRELAEETGIRQVQLLPGFSREMAYFFRGKQGLVRKTVRFFLGRVESEAVQLSSEHCAYAWLPFEPALERLGFTTAKKILQAAHEYLSSSPR